MKISHLTISNLRSVANMNLSFSKVTTLIGGNNAGKSTVLRALQIFFEPAPKMDDDDFHNREAPEILVTIEFKDFTPAELVEFNTAIIGDSMTVTRSFTRAKDENHLQYSVTAMCFPGFDAIRAETNGTQKKSLYNALAKELDGLEVVARVDEIADRLAQWEAHNQNQLGRQSVRSFFGVPNVACGKLRKKTSVHYVPAVADASQETNDPRKSPIIVLLAEIAKQVYENREEVRLFVEQSNADFSRITNPENFPQLANISEQLTTTIQKYYRDSKLLANWEQTEGLRVSFPQPVIKIEDNGFISGLQNVGHGLQRAALFSVIEFLASRGSRPEDGERFETAQSDIILLIEEPEIYQHPIKQQVIHDAFHKICTDFNKDTGIRFQIIFTTHSEKFIGMSKFQSARILRKSVEAGLTTHSCSAIEIEKCSEYFAAQVGQPQLSDAAFEAKMHIFSRELCEGFFASKVILVEGVCDKAVIEGAYRAAGRSPEAEGIAILSVDGKTKMDKPLYIFRKLGIPTYPVFDSDVAKRDKRTRINKLIQLIVGVENPADFPDGIFEKFGSYGTDMEGYFKEACGDMWEGQLSIHKEEYGFEKDDICKTPNVVAKICDELRKSGKAFDRLDQIIQRVDELTV